MSAALRGGRRRRPWRFSLLLLLLSSLCAPGFALWLRSPRLRSAAAAASPKNKKRKSAERLACASRHYYLAILRVHRQMNKNGTAKRAPRQEAHRNCSAALRCLSNLCELSKQSSQQHRAVQTHMMARCCCCLAQRQRLSPAVAARDVFQIIAKSATLSGD